MTIPLLQTKLFLPAQRPHQVPRPRLVERLNDGLVQGGGFGRKLTLVCAPAGYGKTSLATEWLQGRDYPVAWLSLDEGDNDPARYLAYQALHQGRPC